MDEVIDLATNTDHQYFDGKKALVTGLALVAGFIAAASTRKEMTKVFFPETDKN